jgi:hypothetical protein
VVAAQEGNALRKLQFQADQIEESVQRVIPAIDVIAHEKKVPPFVEGLRSHKLVTFNANWLKGFGLFEKPEKVVKLSVDVALNVDREGNRSTLFS